MYNDERENDPDLLEELKVSRLRLKYNWENLFKKYENIEECGIEIQLDTFEVFAPEGMDRKCVTKAVEKHEMLGSQFGSAAFAAPCNEDSLQDCHPKILEKCRRMDKEFSKINEVHSLVPHRQKMWNRPRRPKQILIKKIIRQDFYLANHRQPLREVAIDNGLSDGPLPEHIQSALNAPPEVPAICNSEIPTVALNNGCSDGPISSELCFAKSQRRFSAPALMSYGPSTSSNAVMLNNGLSDGPIALPNYRNFSRGKQLPLMIEAPNTELPTCSINNGLEDGPIVPFLQTERTEESRESLNLSSTVSSYFSPSSQPSTSELCETLANKSDINDSDIKDKQKNDVNCAKAELTTMCKKANVLSPDDTNSTKPVKKMEKTKVSPGKRQNRRSLKRSSTENIPSREECKKKKIDSEDEVDLVLDATTMEPKNESIPEMNAPEFWSIKSCGPLLTEIENLSCKQSLLLGNNTSRFDRNLSMMSNWIYFACDCIENVANGQDYVAKEERRLMSSARRRNSLIYRGSAV